MKKALMAPLILVATRKRGRARRSFTGKTRGGECQEEVSCGHHSQQKGRQGCARMLCCTHTGAIRIACGAFLKTFPSHT